MNQGGDQGGIAGTFLDLSASLNAQTAAAGALDLDGGMLETATLGLIDPGDLAQSAAEFDPFLL